MKALILLLALSASASAQSWPITGGGMANVNGQTIAPSTITIPSGTGSKCFSADDPTLVVDCNLHTVSFSGSTMTVLSTGRVGIGTSSPVVKVHISSGGIMVDGNTTSAAVPALEMHNSAGGIFVVSGGLTEAWDTDMSSLLGTAGPNVFVSNVPSNYQMALSQVGANASPATLVGVKTRRANDVSANTKVALNDDLFSLEAWGADGANYRQAAAIKMSADSTPAASIMPGSISFWTSPQSATPAQRMVITSSGNVGIGTISPQAPLHVVGIALSSRTYIQTETVNTDISGLGSHRVFVAEDPANDIGIGICSYTNSSGGAIQNFYNTRSVSPTCDANSTSINGDIVMDLRSNGATGTTFKQGARIRTVINDAAIGENRMSMDFEVMLASATAGAVQRTLLVSNSGGTLNAVRTKAQLDAITPAYAGEQFTCSDCTVPYDICTATAATLSSFRATIFSAISTATPGTLVAKGCGTGQ